MKQHGQYHGQTGHYFHLSSWVGYCIVATFHDRTVAVQWHFRDQEKKLAKKLKLTTQT